MVKRVETAMDDGIRNEISTENIGSGKAENGGGKPPTIDNAAVNGENGSNFNSPNAPEQTATGKRRGRPPGTKNRTNEGEIAELHKAKVKPPKKPTPFMSMNDAQNSTAFLLALVEGFAVSNFGDDAKMNDMEKLLLSQSLPRMLAGMSSAAAQKTMDVLYPFAVLIGFGAYGLRVYRIEQKRNAEKVNDESEDIKVDKFTPYPSTG